MKADPRKPFWGGEEQITHRESWPEKLALRKLLGCEAERHIPGKLRKITKGTDNTITAGEIVQIQIHNNDYKAIPPPERIEGEAPKEINVYSDGSVKNLNVAYWRTGGIGVQWPERSPDEIPMTAAEAGFMRHRIDDNGFTAWNAYNDIQNSSTRTEIEASLMAMQPKVEVNIGIDNEATVNIGNTIIKHQILRHAAKLREEEGSLRLGGSISKLYRESPFKRICPLMKMGIYGSFLFNPPSQKDQHRFVLPKSKVMRLRKWSTKTP